MSENQDKILSLSEASQLTGYHQDYLGQLCRSGKLRGQKIGRNWTTTQSAVTEFQASLAGESVGTQASPSEHSVAVHVVEAEGPSSATPEATSHRGLSGTQKSWISNQVWDDTVTANDAEQEQSDPQKFEELSSDNFDVNAASFFAGLTESAIINPPSANHVSFVKQRMQDLHLRNSVENLETKVAGFEAGILPAAILSNREESQVLDASPMSWAQHDATNKDTSLKNKFASNFDFGQDKNTAATSSNAGISSTDIKKLFSSFQNPKSQNKFAVATASTIAVVGLFASVVLAQPNLLAPFFGQDSNSHISYIAEEGKVGGVVAVTNGTDSNPQGQVLGTTVVVHSAQQPVTEITESYIDRLILFNLEQLMNSGWIKGAKGDPGPAGPVGSSGGGGGGSGPVYIQPYIPYTPTTSNPGGTLAAFTNLSSDTFNTRTAAITQNLSVGGNASVTGNLSVTGTITGSVSGSIDPGFTEGSVVFQGASGLDQDNANFFWNDTTNRLGLGTLSPQGTLDIRQSANGTPTIYARRATDVLPSGDFITYTSADGLTNLFRVDNGGNVSASGSISGGAQTITSTSQPQLRVQYDGSNEWTSSTNATGVTTFNFNGSAPQAIFIPQVDSGSAFDFQDSAGDSLFRVDTTGRIVNVGENDGPAKFNIYATMTSATSFIYGQNISVDADNSLFGNVNALNIELEGAFAGSTSTNGIRSFNALNSTATQLFTGPAGNSAVTGIVSNSTAGHNAGLIGYSVGSSSLNSGVFGVATSVSNSPVRNIGVVGQALNATNNIGGYFYLGSTTPAGFTSAALLANNGSQSAPIFIAQDNASQVFIIADGGNVGIGSDATPAAALTVGDDAGATVASGAGDAYIQSDLEVDGTLTVAGATTYSGALSVITTTSPQLTVGYDSSNKFTTAVAVDGGTTWAMLGTDADLNVSFSGATDGDFSINTDDLFVDTSTGRVGIGTATPGRDLDIYGTNPAIRLSGLNGTSPQVLFGNQAGTEHWAIYEYLGGGGEQTPFYIYDVVAGVNRFSILPTSGNVGIGNITPQSTLHTYGTLRVGGNSATNQTGTIVLGNDTTTDQYVGIYRGTAAGVIGGGDAINIGSYGGIAFNTSQTTLGSQTQRMLITSDGNIGFNTSSWGANSSKVIAVGAGTAPTVSPADVSQLWTADWNGAGTNALFMRTEEGTQHVFGSNVGISTTTPRANLEVYGAMRYGGSTPISATTVSDNPLTSGATTVNVSSTTGYATSGTLVIEAESMTYTGISGNAFTGVTRGVLGTTAASHASGARIDNYLSIAQRDDTNPKFTLTASGRASFGRAVPSTSYTGGLYPTLEIGSLDATFPQAVPGSAYLSLNSGAGAIPGLVFARNSVAQWSIVDRHDDPGRLSFMNAGSGQTFNFLQNGSFGINDTSPDANLEVVNDASGDSFLVADSGDGDTTPFVIDSAGKVGIGTAGPDQKLRIVGGSTMIDVDQFHYFVDTNWGIKVDDTATGALVSQYGMIFKAGGDLNTQGWVFQDHLGNNRMELSGGNGVLYIPGNVGIGSDTTPVAGLTVGADTTAGVASGAGDGYFQNDLEVDGTLTVAGATTYSGTLSIITTTSPQLTVGYDSSNKFTTAVASDGGTTWAMLGTDADLNVDFSGATDGDFSINTDDLFVDTSTGYVGIGTNNLSSIESTYNRLIVQGSDAAAVGQTIINTGIGQVAFGLTRTGGTASRWLTYLPTGSTDLRLWNAADLVTFQADGEVGIGTASPTALLDVNNTTTSAITAGANARVLNLQGAFTEAGSGTHSRIAGMEITPPTITAGVATVTNTASLYISDAPTATVTGANYSLWVDSGNSRFDGALQLNGGSFPSAGEGLELIASNDIGYIQVYNRDTSSWGDLQINVEDLAVTTNGGFTSFHGANVGIADFSPDAALEVVNDGSGDSFLVADSADGDTTPFVIQADGDVGIGTTAPLSGKLDIRGPLGTASWKTSPTDGTGGYNFGFAFVQDTSTFDGTIGYFRMVDTDGTLVSGRNIIGLQIASGGDHLLVQGNNGLVDISASNRFRFCGGSGTCITASELQANKIRLSPSFGTADGLTDPGDGGVHFPGNSYFATSTGSVGIGTASPDGKLEIAGNVSLSAWGLNGIQLQGTAATFTDTSTAAAGTATNAVISSLGQSTLASTNAITTTNAYGLYLAGAPISGANQTLTNTTALYIGAAATTDGAGGTPTNSYGLYVNAQTGAINNYAAQFDGGNVNIRSGKSLVLYRTDNAISGSIYEDDTNAINISSNTGISLTGDYFQYNGQFRHNSAYFYNTTGSGLTIRGATLDAGTALTIDTDTTLTTGKLLDIKTGTVSRLLVNGNGTLRLDSTGSAAAWGLNGIQLQGTAATFTDSSTAAAGTATNAVFTSFGQPTLAATNLTVTTTNAATVYIAAAPAAGTNQTITNAYALWVGAGTSRFDGYITAPGAGGLPDQSERFGYGAAAGLDGTSLGFNANAGGAGVSIGKNSVSATSSTAVGQGASANNFVSTAIGSAASANSGYDIALGYGATTTAASQFVAGSNTAPITNVYIGNGVTNTAPSGFVLQGSGGSGTDIAGASVTIAGGKATGNAAGGDILFQTSDASASGATLQSLTTKMTLTELGNLGIGTTAPAGKLNVSATPTATPNYGLVSIGTGPWDGSTSGYFVGDSFGTVLAINTPSYVGTNLRIQEAGVDILYLAGDTAGAATMNLGTGFAGPIINNMSSDGYGMTYKQTGLGIFSIGGTGANHPAAMIYDGANQWTIQANTDNASYSALLNVNSKIALTTSGARLLSLQNNGTQKAFVDKDGGGYFAGSTGIGTTGADAKLEIAGNMTQAAWGFNGIQLQGTAATYTDSSTAASGTATNAVFNSFGQPTLAATNATVTTTNAANVYIAAAPAAGSNQTITNSYALWVDAGTSRFDGDVYVGPEIVLDTYGRIYAGTAVSQGLYPGVDAGFVVTPRSGTPSAVGMVVQGLASQAGDLTQWRDNGTSVIASVSASGGAFFNGNVGISDNTADYKLEISSAASSDPSLALSDGDITHGLTTVAETDVIFHMAPLSSTAGGIQLSAITESDAQALSIRGIIGATDPTNTTPAVRILGAKSNGTTGIADLAALETVFQVANNATNLFTVLGGGKIGIGDVTSIASGNLPAGSVVIGNGALCVDNGGDNCDDAGRTAGTVYSVGTDVTGIDLAENYPSIDTTLTPGELVMIDSNNNEFIKRANQPYGKTLLGVVSTAPGVILGGFRGSNEFSATKQYPIALTGRVPVKVTNENGNIKPGDYLTASTQFSGFAMKATRSGQIIGQALESFNSSTPSSSGNIVVFMQVGYQQINNTIVLDAPVLASDDQSSLQGPNQTGLTAAETSTTFIIKQESANSQTGLTNSLSDILQLQSGDANRLMVSTSGVLTLNAEVLGENQKLFVINNNGSELFSIKASGLAVLWGTLVVKQDLAVMGRILGTSAILAQNISGTSLEIGDLVVLAGASNKNFGDIPVIAVMKSTASSPDAFVVGIVDRNMTSLINDQVNSVDNSLPIGPDDYLSIVTTGSYKTLKVDSSGGAITTGDKLTLSATPGLARKWATGDTLPVVAVALDGLATDTGTVRVFLMATQFSSTSSQSLGDSGSVPNTTPPPSDILIDPLPESGSDQTPVDPPVVVEPQLVSPPPDNPSQNNPPAENPPAEPTPTP